MHGRIARAAARRAAFNGVTARMSEYGAKEGKRTKAGVCVRVRNHVAYLGPGTFFGAARDARASPHD